MFIKTNITKLKINFFTEDYEYVVETCTRVTHTILIMFCFDENVNYAEPLPVPGTFIMIRHVTLPKSIR
jgi:hypothetical protein